jgi:signal recognition particle receptor subunit beta
MIFTIVILGILNFGKTAFVESTCAALTIFVQEKAKATIILLFENNELPPEGKRRTTCGDLRRA